MSFPFVKVCRSLLFAACFLCSIPYPARSQSVPVPRIIHLDMGAAKSSDIFKGPPETVTMRSGYVVLPPSKSVGKHTTGRNEEVLLVLQGTGELRITGNETLKIHQHCVTYCPPMAEHDVVNTGQDTLRYIWLVARAQH